MNKLWSFGMNEDEDTPPMTVQVKRGIALVLLASPPTGSRLLDYDLPTTVSPLRIRALAVGAKPHTTNEVSIIKFIKSAELSNIQQNILQESAKAEIAGWVPRVDKKPTSTSALRAQRPGGSSASALTPLGIDSLFIRVDVAVSQLLAPVPRRFPTCHEYSAGTRRPASCSAGGCYIGH